MHEVPNYDAVLKSTGVRRFALAAPIEQPYRVVVLEGLACAVARWRSACGTLDANKQTMPVSVQTYI
jgi:hypothetical protein